MVKRQTKSHQIVLRGSVWVGLSKSAVRFGLEKCQTVYLRFGLGYITNRTNPNLEHPYHLHELSSLASTISGQSVIFITRKY